MTSTEKVYFHKHDRTKQTPGVKQLPGENGTVEISEAVYKQVVLLYAAQQSSISFASYDTTEMNIVDTVTKNMLLTRKKGSMFSCAARGTELREQYKNSIVAKRLVQMKVKPTVPDLSFLFALDTIKRRHHQDHFTTLEVVLSRGGTYEIDFLKDLLRRYIDVCNLQTTIPIFRLCFTLDNPILHNFFTYDALLYQSSNFEHRHTLSLKMLECKYLSLKVKLEDTSQLDEFNGWGLHVLAARQNNLEIAFVTQELESWCRGGVPKRKLTALSKDSGENEPTLFGDSELAPVLHVLEEARIDCWMSVDGNFVNRVYTKANGDQAALIVERDEPEGYSSIVFLHPYDVTSYKFVRGGQNTHFK